MLDIQQAQQTRHSLNRVAEWISRVSEPLILIGSGIAQSRVRYELIELATQLGIPIASTLAANTVIPKTHRLFTGTIDSPRSHIRCGFDWADLVISIGCRTEECDAHLWNPDGDIPTIHIDTSAAEITAYYQPKLQLVGNLSRLLRSIMQRANRDHKPSPYCSDSSERGQIKIRPLSPTKLGESESYTLNPSDQTILMQINAGAIEGLSVHHFRTNRLHTLHGTAVLVIAQGDHYEYIPLSDQAFTEVEIPPGIPYGVINLSTSSCLIVNAITQHGPLDERDECSLRLPSSDDIAKALQRSQKVCGFPTHSPALKALRVSSA